MSTELKNKERMEVIMLPGEKAKENSNDLLLCTRSYNLDLVREYPELQDIGEKGKLYLGVSKYMDERYFKRIHIYICSDRETKMEDQKIVIEHNRGAGNPFYRIFRKGHLETLSMIPSSEESKYWIKSIIASTDKTLSLPEPSREFIEKLVDNFNKNTPIVQVMVDMEYRCKEGHSMNFGNTCSYPYCHLPNYYTARVKLDNTITITKWEGSWDDVLDRMSREVKTYGDDSGLTYDELQWLKENYYPPKPKK